MESQRTLTVACVTGLSNRIRVLLSGKALAGATEREFAMRWVPTLPCGCFFHHLFQNEWNVGGHIHLDPEQTLDLTHVAPEAMPDLRTMTNPVLEVIHHDWLVQPARYPEHGPLKQRCQELMQELAPIPSLEKRIKDFRDAYFRPVMIGVHVRRGDVALVRPQWLADPDKVMRQIDEWLAVEGDAGILVCTDEGAADPQSGRAASGDDVTAQFEKRYGDRVVVTKPSNLDRRTPAAIQSALVDMYLLRATDYFIGTPKSSFSELAALGRPT